MAGRPPLEGLPGRNDNFRDWPSQPVHVPSCESGSSMPRGARDFASVAFGN